MTEYNYFCWSEEYNDENSFQQKRFRVFNTEVSKEEYDKIKKIYHKIELNPDDDYTVRFKNGFRKMWNTLSKEGKQEYLDIPHFNMKWFTFITGITEDDIKELKTESLSGKEVEVIVNGTTYTAIIK